MALEYVPLTELEAVNIMLEVIGELPVSSLEAAPTMSEANIARTLLHNISRDVQTHGLECNTDTDYELSLNEDSKIEIPTNALRVDATDRTKSIVIRGGFLYDKDNRTDVFSESLKCDIVWFLDFADLPQHVRAFITIRAGRVFQARHVGSDVLNAFTERDELQAYMLMQKCELQQGDYSIFSNYSAGRILNRTARY